MRAFSRRGLLRAGAALPLAAGFAGRALAEDALSEVGPLEVSFVDADLRDEARGRSIATRAYYPAKPGRYPVIVFSHGFGGSLLTFTNTGRIWASHGYVVLHPTHSDSLARMDPGAPPAEAAVMRQYHEAAGAPSPQLRQAFVKVLDNPFFIDSRLRDVGVLVSAVKQGKGLDRAIVERADPTRMGMSGHSFGAYTTLVMAGALLSPPVSAPVTPGFAGFLSMSGQGPGRMALHDDSFAGITKPMMVTTGTRDFGAAGETPPWRLKPFDLSPPGDKYAVVVDGFAHREFDPAPGNPRGAALRVMQLRFWAGALRGDAAARAALDRQADASKPTDPVWLRRR
ncbi:hypothetical protein [Phenylobacterium sp.]|uniref:alpha/beta hydrolase family protein n=1 Tax=Phenylobacterium sp. TaxID=1871053 RepID=UPI0025F7B57B|nr:hypothetical protein [Phenylobacterium sp.]MBX3483767.1 hypothetical protein [Phenylobacterium sp.]